MPQVSQSIYAPRVRQLALSTHFRIDPGPCTERKANQISREREGEEGRKALLKTVSKPGA